MGPPKLNRGQRRRAAKSSAGQAGGEFQFAFANAVEHYRAGRLGEAQAILKKLQRRNPGNADVGHLLGVIALQSGRPGDAVSALRKAARADPDSAPILNVLGSALRRDNRLDAAAEALGRAVTVDPGFADAHYNLANVFKDLGRLDEAGAHYGQAISLDPGFADAHFNLAQVLRWLGQAEPAADHYEQALTLEPGKADIHNGLGVVLVDMARTEAAEAQFRKALALDPGLAEAHTNLAGVVAQQGRVAEAFELLKRALELDPGLVGAHSNLIYCQHDMPGYSGTALLAEAREWDRRHGRPFTAKAEPHGNDPDPDRRLRIGYVSADFRTHPVGHFFAPVIANHDGDGFETFCYSGVGRADALTEQIKDSTANWRDIVGADDDSVADLIRGDRIDILVDLAGHTDGNRLLVFARKPAPVQVTGGGTFGTSGLDAMDYMISDEASTPDGSEGEYSETVVRLATGCWCYRPPVYAPPVAPLPASERNFVTFGCFNGLAKVGTDVVALWARILETVPTARLVMRTTALGDEAARAHFETLFAAEGIGSERLTLGGGAPHEEFLGAYADIDIALDSFPFSGGLTTLEALWMGVPVITAPGDRFCSRHAASHLTNVGLSEFIAGSPAAYVEAAAGLANDRPRLEALRASLRQRVAASPACDGGTYARNLETVYRDIWQAWCADRR